MGSTSRSSSRQLNGHASSVNGTGKAEVEDDMPDQWPSGPIARVNSVAEGSPAESAVSVVSKRLAILISVELMMVFGI